MAGCQKGGVDVAQRNSLRSHAGEDRFMTVPVDARFSHTHAWVVLNEDGLTIRVGISDYLQHRLSDIVNVDLPEPDDHQYDAEEDVCLIESLTTTTDLHAPVAGVITAINTELLSSPERINEDPYGAGWIVEMRPNNLADIEELSDADEYEISLPDEDEEEE